MESKNSKYFSKGSSNWISICTKIAGELPVTDYTVLCPWIPNFSIDETTIIVADESLDYETIDEKNFEIVIIVTDRGNPNSLSSNQTINLTVGDINDENPTLRLFNIEENVLENQPAGF